MALLHRLAGQRDPALPLPHPARPAGAGPSGSRRPTHPGPTRTTSRPTPAGPSTRCPRFDTPPVTDLIRLPSHQVVRALVENAALRAAVESLVPRPTEFFKVTVGGGVTLDGWMIRPRDFDSTRTYPLLMYVYGEPAGQTVLDRWRGVSGALVPRCSPIRATWWRAWTTGARRRRAGAPGARSCTGRSGCSRAASRRRPSARSRARAATSIRRGWRSGAGAAAARARCRRCSATPTCTRWGWRWRRCPTSGCTTRSTRSATWGSRRTTRTAYRLASAITFADGLHGQLLLVHGSGDDNVHYQGTERLVNRLVALGKPFDFMVYPNRSHCICEGRGTTLHVYLPADPVSAGAPAGGGALTRGCRGWWRQDTPPRG